MREVAFLKKNADTWKQFEQVLKNASKVDPDELGDLFIRITNDLSYAKTFYPNSKTVSYLEGLSAEAHQALYVNKRLERGRLVRFWRDEVPLVVRSAHPQLLIAFLIFLISIAMGALSAANDAYFLRMILGDHYVNMTLANIEKGDPMAVYKQANEIDMFLGITINNVRVSLFAFAMGLIASLGTALVLFQNGVMVGAFHQLFYDHGILFESMLVVYIHGALELPAIVIAGAAGIVMGNSFLFPGTYSRGASFVRGARNGMKIVLSLTPVFIVAGFLEGFVTRHTGMPLFLSLTIITASFSFIMWYYIIYPIQVSKRVG